jgi:mycofactocin system transcriptional regulator
MVEPARTSARGRPVATSHAAIEQAAFELFTARGFASTTLDDIARATGVGRRTLFRYFESKNDIPWGRFDLTLAGFRELLADQPLDVPLHVAVHRAVVAFNRFPADARPSHRERMRLILTTPELEAHSVLRYADWRAVIAEYVSERTGAAPSDLQPQLVAHVALAQALTAYEAWLRDDDAVLEELLDETMAALTDYLGTAQPGRTPGAGRG